MFEMAFEGAESLGEQAVIICMDSNVKAETNYILSRVLSSGRWHDIGMLHGGAPTYGRDKEWDKEWDKHSEGVGVPRPDLLIENTAAKERIIDF